MKKIVLGLFLLGSASFASVQNIANVSDLKESIVILIENQRKIERTLSSLEEKMNKIDNAYKSMAAEMQKVDKKSAETQKSIKKEMQDTLKNIQNENKNLEGKIKEISKETLKDEKKNEDKPIREDDVKSLVSEELEGLRNEVANLKKIFKSTGGGQTIIQLDSFLVNEDGSVDDSNSPKKKEKPKSISGEIQEYFTDKNKKAKADQGKGAESNQGKEIANQGKEAKAIQGKEITKEDGVKLLLKSIDSIEKRLDWLDYKIESIGKEVKKCCKKEKENILFDYELK